VPGPAQEVPFHVVQDQIALSWARELFAFVLRAWYVTFPAVALACRAGSIAAVTNRRGWPVVTVGDAVKVSVLDAVTAPFALLVAVRVYFPAVVV
jgi:hypothetical protein